LVLFHAKWDWLRKGGGVGVKYLTGHWSFLLLQKQVDREVEPCIALQCIFFYPCIFVSFPLNPSFLQFFEETRWC
jgi:hypothetical protein